MSTTATPVPDKPRKAKQEQLSNQFQWARTSIPFIINTTASVVVAATLSFTDERFVLLVLTLEALILVNAFAALATLKNLYVSQLGTFSLNLLLIIMAPIYLFQLLQEGLNQASSPLWFEYLAYAGVVLFLLLALVSAFATEALETLAWSKPQKPKSERPRHVMT